MEISAPDSRNAISTDKASATSKGSLIEKWKEFCFSQPIIKTLVNPADIESMFDLGHTLTEDVAFSVLFPKSFHHLADFKEEAGFSVACAAFLHSGEAELHIADNVETVSYSDAWDQVYLRTTGESLTPLSLFELPSKIIEQESVVLNRLSMVSENLKLIIAKFNAIRGIHAGMYEDESNPDAILEIKVPYTAGFLLSEKPDDQNDEISYFVLEPGNIHCIEMSDRQNPSSSTYDNWKVSLGESHDDFPMSWTAFYGKVLELIDFYSKEIQ